MVFKNLALFEKVLQLLTWFTALRGIDGRIAIVDFTMSTTNDKTGISLICRAKL
jgi:hypothetical protein